MSNKIKYDEVLILDLETTCWAPGEKPENQESEIIEIGICKLNCKSLKIYDKMSLIVRPENSTVSPYCQELTGLSQEVVEKGVTLFRACEFLKEEYQSNKRSWASWGAYDKHILETQCKLKNVSFPLTNRHINVKPLFSIIFNLPHDYNVINALKLLKMNFEGRQHRGGDDAYNVAKIFAECLRGGPLP